MYIILSLIVKHKEHRLISKFADKKYRENNQVFFKLPPNVDLENINHFLCPIVINYTNPNTTNDKVKGLIYNMPIEFEGNYPNLRKCVLHNVIITDINFIIHSPFIGDMRLINTNVHDISALAGRSMDTVILIDNDFINYEPLKDLCVKKIILKGLNYDELFAAMFVKAKHIVLINCTTYSNAVDFSDVLEDTRCENLCVDGDNSHLIDEYDDNKSKFIMPNIKYLYLKNIYFHNINAISNLKKLTVLQIKNTRVTDLRGIESLMHLTELDISENNIEDIRPLSRLPLKNLNMKLTRVSSISCLPRTIVKLNISINIIGDISRLSQLDLHYLDMRWTFVFDYRAIFFHRNLRVLGVSDWRIAKWAINTGAKIL